MNKLIVSLGMLVATSVAMAENSNGDINQAFRGGGRSVEFLNQINKASIVMLDEGKLLPHRTAAQIASGIEKLIEKERQASPQRSADYLDYEPKLIAMAGPDASLLHAGRSRQDIAATIARMNLRDGLLREYEALLGARRNLLALAEKHTDTIIPAYTHGVQAQPTTFAHYLLALQAGLDRQGERLQEAYRRINRSPLGAAALATSGFPIDRKRLAVLLGFDGLVENSYDANHLASVDSNLEVAGALEISAIQIGQFAQDVHAQYAAALPWLALSDGKLNGISSIMPQKRNPAAIEQLHAQSSIMVGEMQTVFLMAHNTRTGMFDYRSYDPIPSERPVQLYQLLQKVLGGLAVDKARALAEVNADYSTTSEIADALLRKSAVPFRVGHHFASRLTDYGRGKGLKLSEIPYMEAARIYQADTNANFPLSQAEFKEIISAEYMVFSRKGIGGPQLAEVNRMLVNERSRMTSDTAWLTDQSDRLARAEVALNKSVADLAGSAAAAAQTSAGADRN